MIKDVVILKKKPIEIVIAILQQWPSLFYLPDAMIVLLAFPKATNATPTGIRKPAPPNIFRPHVCKKPQ